MSNVQLQLWFHGQSAAKLPTRDEARRHCGQYRLSLPKTLFKLTRGLRRNQNIIAA